jgi:hypothetical protein
MTYKYMPKPKTEVEETTSEETQNEETQEENNEETSDVAEESKKDTSYKEKWEKTEADKKVLEQKIASDAYKYRKKKKDDGEESEDEQTEGLSEERLVEILDEREKIRDDKLFNRLNQEKEDEAIKAASSDEYEEKLIRHELETGIKRTGNLKEDIKRAKAIVNSDKMNQTNEELKRTIISKDNKGDGAGAGQKQTTNKEPELSDKDTNALRKAGLKWVAKNSRYEGKKTWIKYNKDGTTSSGRL